MHSRRTFLKAGASVLVGAGALASSNLFRVARAAEVVLPPGEPVTVWEGPEMGQYPYLERRRLERRALSEAPIRQAIDEISDEMVANAWRRPIEVREQWKRQIRRDQEQFHDEISDGRLWEQVPLMVDRRIPLPKYSQVEEIKQGETSLVQFYQGGKRLRNVVADLRGLPEDMTNRQFVLVGLAMRQTTPGICGNCGGQILVENQTDAVCVETMPTGPNVRTVEQGLRDA